MRGKKRSPYPAQKCGALCHKCPLKNKSPVWPGLPSTLTPKLILVGENPGKYEDRVGKPFLGPAGQTLEQSLSIAAGLSYHECHRTNVILCLPPKGIRLDTYREAIACCKPRLELELLDYDAPIFAMGYWAVLELTGGVHHAFEAVGMKETAEQAFAMLRPGGQATVIGMIPVGTKVEIHGPDLLSEKQLTGSNMGSNQFRTDMPRFVDMYLDGRLNLDDMISNTIGLDEINAGFDAMKAGNVARSVIAF